MSEHDLKFTKTHEWVRVEDGTAVVGLSDYAQGELGDIVFVELPEVGASVSKGDSLTTIESVKSVSEIYAPLSGRIAAVNDALDDAPDKINSDAHGEGWIVKMDLQDPSELEGLMSASEYEEFTKG